MKATVLFVLFFTISTGLFAQIRDSAWVFGVEARALAAFDAGDLQLSKDVCFRALDTAQTRYGEYSWEVAYLLEGLSQIQKFTGDFVGAGQTTAAALEHWKKLTGERSLEVAVTLNQLGYIRYRLGQYETVEKLLTESRQLFIDLGMDPSYQLASLYSDLASFYDSQGLLLKAEQEHLKAIRTAQAIPDIDPRTYGILLNNIAVFYSSMQRNQQALQYMDDYLNLQEKIYPQNHPFYLNARANKAGILIDAGRYGEAKNLLGSILDVARKTMAADDPQLAFYLRKLAALDMKVGQFEEARQLRSESLALLKNRYGDAHPDYGVNLMELATALQYCKRMAEADTLLRESIRIMEREKRTQTIQYAQALTYLGNLYQQEQQVALARPWLEQGARLGAKIYGPENPKYYDVFVSALIRQEQLENRPDSALRLLDVMREPVFKAYGSHHPTHINLETQYGKSLQLKGDAARALQHFRAAFEALQSILAENFSYMSIDEREKFARGFERYREAFLGAARAFPGDDNIRAFLYDLTLFQKELLASYDRQLFAGWQQNNDARYNEYLDLRRMIARQWSLPAAERRDLPELEARRASLEKTLAETSGVAATPDVFRPAHWQQIQQALKPGDAALEWLRLPSAQEGREAPCYAVLVLRPDQRAPELVLLPPVAGIDSLFASKGARGLQYATRTYTGNTLYGALWKPLESRLSGVQRIFYAPTGNLHLLNFDALQTPGGQLLSERYRLVRVTNTARLLDEGFGAALAATRGALLAGGLDYESAATGPAPGTPDIAVAGSLWRGGSSVREWSPLPNTLPEVERLAGLLRKKNVPAELLTGSQGGETPVKARCSAAPPDILHFATHGFFFEKNSAAPGSLGLVTAENPMLRSGLILAGANPAWRGAAANDTPDDGILTADEISLLPLRNTALVVLSACETGLGDVRDDEGVYGLQRAFRLAGAQNLVMSLWRIPDVQTREFMEDFYAALLEKGDIRGSFMHARQTIRKKFGNPYYWAGFVLLE